LEAYVGLETEIGFASIFQGLISLVRKSISSIKKKVFSKVLFFGLLRPSVRDIHLKIETKHSFRYCFLHSPRVVLEDQNPLFFSTSGINCHNTVKCHGLVKIIGSINLYLVTAIKYRSLLAAFAFYIRWTNRL
jgi:hypothetical protein